MQRYFLSVLSMGIICGICQSIASDNGETEKLVKAFSGAILLLVCIRPMLSYDMIPLGTISQILESESNYAVSEGVKLRESEISNIITDRIAAYIEGIAEEENTPIMVQVNMENGTLSTIQLDGVVSPNLRRRITRNLAESFGIEEGYIQWNP